MLKNSADLTKKTNIFKFHLKDARNLANIIPLNTIDVTITSPPYGSLKNYGDFKGQIGYGQKYEEEYLADLQHIFKDVFDVTKDTGSLWVIVDTFKERAKVRLLPFDLTIKLENVGWKLQDIIIWNKTKSLPWSRKGQLRKIFEYILFFTKTKKFKYRINRIKKYELKEWWIRYPERYNPQGKTPSNVWEFPIPTQGSWGNSFIHHFCPFPPELVERVLLLTTDEEDVVLDPFAGSGVVLAQAKCMRRKFVGFDLNKEYIRKFKKNVFPQIKREYRKRQDKLDMLKKVRKKRAEDIKKLRLLKYPKTLVVRLLKKRNLKDLDELPIHSIFAIRDKFQKDKTNNKFKFLRERVYIILNRKVDRKKLFDDIFNVSNKIPLSKFGVEAEFLIFSLKDFAKKYKKRLFFDGAKLWIYTKGVTNVPTKLIDFKEWEDGLQSNWFDKKYPPIVSNVYVNCPTEKKKE